MQKKTKDERRLSVKGREVHNFFSNTSENHDE